MKKRERDWLLAEGRKCLAEWGIAASAGETELRAVMGRDPAADLALAELLGGLKEAWAVTLLDELERHATHKAVRKEIQRSRFRLAQRGLASLASRAEQQPAFEAPKPTYHGYLTDFGLRDIRLALILREELAQTESVLALFQPRALEHCLPSARSRRKVERLFRELCGQFQLHPFEADWHHVDFLLWRAEQLGQRQEQAPERRYTPIRRKWFGDLPPEEAAPPIYSLLDSDAVRNDTQALERSAQLLHHPSVAPFTVDPLAEAYAAKLLEVRQSPLVLNELQIAEREKEVIREAVEAFFTGEHRQLWIHRLEELAYAFHQWGDLERARQCLALALALRDEPQAHQRLAFCLNLVEAAVPLAAQALQQEEQEKAKERLIVTPPSPSATGRHRS